VERARSALERAEKRLASKQEQIDYMRARAALERALYRIRMVESRSRG
jgi:F-type H+-transporting ATPase subunit epsilon